MPHILFDGDIRKHPALRSLFWQWGVTVGHMPAGGRDGSRVTVEDCDAVVQVCEAASSSALDSHTMPDGAGTEGMAAPAAAPLLVIGSLQDHPSSWVTIPGPGPGGAYLRPALESCRERARELRGDPVSGQDQDRFRDFLGHELRTPLTAIKTALSVVQNGEDLPSGSNRMLGIAQRNLDRLEDTVEWSRELAILAETTLGADMRPISLAALAEVLPEHLQVEPAQLDATDEVLTDPALLGLLVRQMERVISFACPGCGPACRLDWDAQVRGGRLTVTACPDEAAASIPRAGYVEGEGTLAKIEQLSRMLISPNLLQTLGVMVRATGRASHLMELSLVLPASAGSAHQLTEPLPTV